MNTPNIERKNVAVDVSFDYGGHMIPTTIHDTEGEIHWIERIVCMQPAIYSCEGCWRGERYTVLSEGKMKSLCFEQLPDLSRTETGRWFLEEELESNDTEEVLDMKEGIQLNIESWI